MANLKRSRSPRFSHANSGPIINYYMATVHEVPFRTIPQHSLSPLPAKKRALESVTKQMNINNIINPVSESPKLSKVIALDPFPVGETKKKQPHKHPKLAHAKSKIIEPKVTSADKPIINNATPEIKPVSPKMPTLSLAARNDSTEKLRPTKIAKRPSPPRETPANVVVRYSALCRHNAQHPKRSESVHDVQQSKKQAIQGAKSRFAYFQTGETLYGNHLIPTLPTFLLNDTKKENGNVLVENGEIV